MSLSGFATKTADVVVEALTPDLKSPPAVNSAGTATPDGALVCYERTDDERYPTAYLHWKHLPYNQGSGMED